MTINMTTNDSASTSSMDYSSLKISGASSSANSQALTSSTSELSEEEKKYDVDGDGTLSITEKAAYLEAQAKQKELESVSKYTKSEDAATLSISDEGLKLQKLGRPERSMQGAPHGQPPNINEMSDDDLKSMLSEMKNRNGQLPKELSSYNDADIENLSDEDMSNIREAMTQMAERRNGQSGNGQLSLVNKAITEYNKFK